MTATGIWSPIGHASTTQLAVRSRSLGWPRRLQVTDLVAIILAVILLRVQHPGASVADGIWLVAVVIAMAGQLVHLGVSSFRQGQSMPWWATPTRTLSVLPLAACVVMAFIRTGAAAPVAANALAMGGPPNGPPDPRAASGTFDAASTVPIPPHFPAIMALAVALVLLALAPRRTDAGLWCATVVLWAWLSPALIAAGLALSTTFALTASNRLRLTFGSAPAILTVTAPLVALVLAQVVLLLLPAIGNALGRSRYRPLLIGMGTATLVAGFVSGVLHDPLLPARFLPGLELVIGGCALAVAVDREPAPDPTDPDRSGRGAASTHDVRAFRDDGAAAITIRLLLIAAWLIAAGVIAGTVGDSLRLDLPVRPLAAAGLGALLVALACTLAAFLFQRDGRQRPIGTLAALLLMAVLLLARLLVEHFLAPADLMVKETIRGVVILGWSLLTGAAAAAIWVILVRMVDLPRAPGQQAGQSVKWGGRSLALKGDLR